MGLAERAAFTAIPALALVATLWAIVADDLPIALRAAWVPSLGIDLAFRIDGLSALMLLMITGIGTAVFVYAGGYLAGDPRQRRLYALLLAFMAAMIGCVTADHLIVLFVFWEATSLTSFVLVGFDHEKPASRSAAQQALLVTGGGGLALLAGFVVLGGAMGSGSVREILERLPGTEPTPALVTALVLILVGAFTKSAQVPFHFWLPNAMAAPTPVSAYLHSATMVTLGVYLLARLDPGFGEWTVWEWSLECVGSVTATWGMVLALRERDLKRILAWSTVAALGTMTVLVGFRGEGAAVAVAALLMAHALYKAPLFFVAGNIDHGAGTRIIDRLGNLRHAMPWTAAAALLAGMSMAGVPLSFGYVVKDVIREAKSAEGVFAFARAANTVFASIAVATAGVAAIRVFWRHPGTNETCDAHEGGLALVAPPLVLAGIGIVLGLFPFFTHPLLSGASVSMTQGTEPRAVDLALDVAPALGSLLGSFVAGAAVYAFWDPLHRLLERGARRTGRVGMAAQYERLLRAVPALSALSTRTLQHGSLPGYFTLALGSVTLLVGAALAAAWGQIDWPGWESPSAGAAGACALIAAGAALTTVVRDRLVLLLAAGLVGYGSAVLFLFTGAPDVAFTQFAVETVFVIVAASVLLSLTRLGQSEGRAERRGPAAVAVAAGFGAAVALLLLAAAGGPFDTSLSRFFGDRSVSDGFGRNVVNVILVDFRAFDTLGEISVVLFSLIAARALLDALRDARSPSLQRAGEPRSVVVDVVAGPLYWLVLAASVAVLLRGHNEPGGGFIGGLMAASASVLWAIARGSREAAARMPLGSPLRLATAGVALSAASGIVAWFRGEPFLAPWWGELSLGITSVSISTVLLFDAGVYLCVWGAVGGYAFALLRLDADPTGETHP